MTDENSQGGSLLPNRTTKDTSNVFPAANELLKIEGRFSPGVILAITIGGIALADVVAMSVVFFIREWPYHQQILIDAAIMTVIIFPLIYLLSFKPLILHIQKRYRSERIIQSRLRLMQYANTHALDELLQFALDEIETLTGSTIGFFHFLEADQTTLWLQAWSTNTMKKMCKAEGKDSHYDIQQAGVWADAVHYRKPIIHNDYASLPGRKGMPEGHAQIIRELVVPILRGEQINAILGLGNKPQDYTANDVEIVTTFADFAWDVVEHKRFEDALHKSEEKFRTFVDWTYDWEYWIDPQGNIVYTSPSCERLIGYTPKELIADPILLNRITHPADQQFYEEHQKLVHEASPGPVTIEYRIISRDGNERWIEHVCRPLFGPNDRYLGRRISDRDITQRKLAEQKIVEQNQKELFLTQAIQTIQTDIARDLHDTLGQNISFLRMNLAYLLEAPWSDPTNIKTQIQNMTKAADESYELIRAMIAIPHYGNLADPINLFSRYAEQVAERSSIQVEITSHGSPSQLSPHQIRQLFFIFREALSNIEKYAQADRVLGEFCWDDHALTFLISDNGRGFDPDVIQAGDHYGIKFMRERAGLLKGSFSIQSVAGQGTIITVTVPYANHIPDPNHMQIR